MNERMNTGVESTQSRRKRGLFGMLAGTLLMGTVVVAPVALDVAHAENWVLQLGPLTGFPRSGTAPFDGSTASPVPSPFTADQGNDANNTNNVIRSGDTQLYAWSLTASNIDSDAGTATTVNGLTLTQVITPDPVGPAPGLGLTVADLEFTPLNPAECPGAGSGIFPNVPVGSISIVCNTGPATTGEQTTVTVRVRPRGTAPNGSRFSSTQSVTATQVGGTPVAPVAYDLGSHPQTSTIYVTNRPEWNLSKHGFGNGQSLILDPDGAGPEPSQRGVSFSAVYQISSARPSGNEALQQPITVHDILSITDNSGNNIVIPAAEYFLQGCYTNNLFLPGTVNGSSGGLPGAVIDGPWADCTPSITRDGGSTSGFSFTFPTIDFDPATYPTQYSTGGSLAAGPFYVASVVVNFFVPKDTIDLGDGSPLDDGGTIQVFNGVGNFDPASVSGGSNWNTGVEPGYCSATESGVPAVPNGGTGLCDTMPVTGVRSDNVIGPSPFTYSEPGGMGIWKDTYRNRFNYLPGETSNKGNDGLVEPTMKWFHRVYMSSSSIEPQRGAVCDVFDNSTAVLTQIDAWYNPSPGETGNYAFVTADGTAVPANSKIEFGHVDLSAIDTMVSYNGLTDRWIGDWTALNTAALGGCAEDGFTTWYSDPNLVPGGVDQVNVVRAVPADGTVKNISAQGLLMISIPLQARETFFGGPHNGDPIPDGTVIANLANSKMEADPALGLPAYGYHNWAYSPEPYIYHVAGERVTVRRAVLNVLKQSIAVDTGYDDIGGNPILSAAASGYDITGNGTAGDYVVWEVTPTITSELAGGSDVTNVTLTDVLPPGVEYDPVCTSVVNGGLNLPSAAQLNTPSAGSTTLTWLLGTVQTNDTVGPFRICTQTDDFAANGTSFTNSVDFTATGLGHDTDTHTVTVSQGSRVKIKKLVDAPLDMLDDDEVWTLQIRNFSDLVNPQTPSMLEVYPWNGDATSNNGGLRNPPSDFDGSNTLQGMPVAYKFDGTTPQTGTFWFTNQAPGLINQDPDGNLAGALTTWCSTPDSGTTWVHEAGPGTVANCPANLAATTGFLFQAATNLAVVSDAVNSGIKVVFTTDATGNSPDNIYTDRFSADSPTFPAAQFLRSNIVTVRTVGFQLGDYVWIDSNGNGKLDVTELPVPNGVSVVLYADDDGIPGPSGGDTELETDTTVNGTYQFTGLAEGDYYVRIPAAEFQSGGLLDGWDITGAAPDATNADLNDTVGHDGTAPGGVTVGGVVSRVAHLSAHYAGDNLIGDEPTLDNTHGLVVDPFQDAFQNFTLDLAVVGPPAIALTKDVCTATTAGDCEVGDANWDPASAFVPLNSPAFWRITVTNTGQQDLYPVEITDPVTPACDQVLVAPLKVGQSFSYVCQGAPVTEAPASPRVNTATVDGNPQAWDPDNLDPLDNVTDEDDAEISTSAVSIGDYVWWDVDRDGQQDSGEAFVAGVTVELLDASGNSIDPDGAGPLTQTTTTTDAAGYYAFTDLEPSTGYRVVFVLPSGAAFTTVDSGADATDSDANPATGEASFTTPASGSNSGAPSGADDPTIDAGLVQLDLTLAKSLTSAGPYYPGSTVTFTLTPHNDGPVNALAGWSVTDILPSGLTLVSMVGSAGGAGIYSCVGLTCTSSAVLAAGADAETILVTATIDAGFTGTAHNVAYVSPAAGEVTETVPLVTPTTSTNTSTSPTNNDAQADVGVDSLVSVGDYVWRDVDRDGQQDSGEAAVSGVTVNIYDGSVSPGNLVDTTSTNGSGFYVFTDLLPGHDYVVEFVAPAGQAFTSQFAAGGTSTDSNANPANGQASVTTPASGNNSATPGSVDEPTIDAGLVEVDLEIGKVLDTATPIHPNDTVTFTLTPSNNGATDSLAGWTVTEIMPARLTLVSMVGSAGVASIYTCVANVCTASTPLAAGASAETIIVTATVNPGPAVTAHNVTYVSPGPGEVIETIPLVIPTTDTDTDDPNTNNDDQADVPVTPLVSIGDYVWWDVNRDGLQTGGEPAVSGVTVELLDASGNSIDPDGAGPLTQTTTTTNGAGFYVFTGLPVSTQFQVKFTPPAGSHFTTAGSGAVAVGDDSNPVVGTGVTPVFSTPADGSNSATPGSADVPTIDAGVVRVDLALAKSVTSVPPYFEGSTVTFALSPTNVGNTNALAGWSVTDILPAGLTATSIVGAAGGASIYTCVLGTLTCTSSAPLGIGAAGEQIIVTATINSDFVGSAHNVAYVSPDDTEVTEVIPLITPDTDTNTSTTPTNNDAQATVSVDSLVSIGDYVWLDVDRDGIQDGSEPPVSGVTVELRDGAGNPIDPDGAGPLTATTTTTDTDGFYFFDDLLPSTSFVVVFTAPADHSFTTENSSGSTAVNDSNADAAGEASVVTPPSGNNETTQGDTDEPTIDAGLVNIDLALVKTLDTAPNFYPGKTIVYTLTPSNLGTTDALAGWSVTEIVPAGMTLVSMAGTGYDCDPLPICVAAGPLAAGATGNTITVTATIDADVTGTLHNVAYISPADDDVVEEIPLDGTPDTDTVADDTATNNDADADLTSNIYDLALAKTVVVTGSGEETVLDYEILIGNQGTVASGDYTVVDVVPPGLNPTDISDGGVYDSGAGTITWELTGLAVGADTSVSWSAEVVDFTLRPYRNFAEISADSGAPWGGDNDSTPDTDNTNDGNYGPILDSAIDNEALDQAGTGDDPSDDADIADANIGVVYDLALAKVPSATTINPDGTVTFSITVENQGDVNSGDFTVTDTLPAGTQATAASDSGTITATTVTWALTDLAPGDTRTVTVTVAITDITLRPFRNIAEISADGADVYDAVDDTYPGADVEDDDSTPDADGTNDGDYGTFENPTNDIDDIADVDSTPNGEDDADVAFFDAPVLYDLALIKTGPASIDGAGTATFTLTIKNQGNVPSGDFTVVDEIPNGLIATAASDGGVIADPLVTWNLTGLAAGATTTVTVTVKVIDFSTRPWVNVAEITSDGADDYDTDGYENPDDGDVEDDDSVPDSDLDNDVLVDQTEVPTDQFNNPTVDEDDHDTAPIDAAIDYDLALVKSLQPGQSFKKGQPIVFDITVKNQGNVDSGPITVQDVVPAGLGIVTASDGGLGVGQVVTWEIANLVPGQIKTLTITVTVVNEKLASYINFAEIVADGADAYDLDGDDVEDADSTPDSDITNDPLVDTDDVNIDQIPGDEDDHDRALLDPVKVKSDNPKGGTVPVTGGNTQPLLFGGAGLLGAGAIALLVARRRRKAAPAT